MAEHTDVFISSTSEDLKAYREVALHVCHRLGMPPIAMEEFGPDRRGAVEYCKSRVYEAEVYVGIFAHRYGWRPEGYGGKSISELEYEWALERDLPILIFMVDDDIAWSPRFIDKDDAYKGLTEFKNKLKSRHIVRFFKSTDQFREDLFLYLPQWRKARPSADTLHYVSDIPKPPEKYIAHPYTLLQTSQLVGRREELNLLTDWVAKPSSPLYNARIFNVVAIGGMGKSAMTWKWFNDIAPQEMNPLAGRMWWSFYESDAHFENFVMRALAYVSRKPREEIQKLPVPERESQLLQILDREPFLLVLDGLERILIAYAHMDAAHLSDDDYDKVTANFVLGAFGLSNPHVGDSFIGQHRLRKTADMRAGQFLRKLAHIDKSHILVSTRLYPAELQIETGEPIPGCFAFFMGGLSDDNALEVWRSIKVTDSEGNELAMQGARDALLPLFRQFENYPLLIRALAGEVANYRRAPGDFDKWRAANPNFTPILMKLHQADAKSHVLKYALHNLNDNAKEVLQTIAAFRSSASYDSLASLLIGNNKPFSDEPSLDNVLTELEDRGLLGWDKRANRYDLHPIVRGIVWGALDKDAQKGVYEVLHTYFAAVPSIDKNDIKSFDDLTPAIELYDKLVRLGRYDDACHLFYERISKATLYRLNTTRQHIELLEMLFPDGIDKPPPLKKISDRAYMLNSLALAYDVSGYPGQAAPLYRLSNQIDEERGDKQGISIGLSNLSDALRLTGMLHEAEITARRALCISRDGNDTRGEAQILIWLGVVFTLRNCNPFSLAFLKRSLEIALKTNAYEAYDYLAMYAIWFGKYHLALAWATKAVEFCQTKIHYERGVISGMRLHGSALLGLDDFIAAESWLQKTLLRARTVNDAENELQTLVSLAELERLRKNSKLSREYLDDVWEGAERGPFPLFHADALNVLAQIERDAGNTDAAIKAATQAYEKAWCDGISADGKTCYAYWWGLQKAKAHLDALGAPYPDLPPFDESKFEPMPEIEINPHDEFYVDESELD